LRVSTTSNRSLDDPLRYFRLMEGRDRIEGLRARRGAEAATRRRRRITALIALFLAVGAVVVIVALASSGGESKSTNVASDKATASTDANAPTANFPASWRPYRGPVPIVEYHAIQPPTPGTPYPDLFVPQADFERQMSWLHGNGYEAVTLKQVEDAWSGHGELPPKPIVVSFDDGYRSQYVAGFLVLQRYHWPGVMDLIAGSQGDDLPTTDVKKMLAAGWELASHTVNHLDVTTLDSSQLATEIAGSKRDLEQRFGVKVVNFCYPAGHYDQAAIAELKRAGYRGATTELPGLADRENPYTLARLEISGSDGLSGFVQKVQSAAPQGPAPASA
jgi:peptidoglycan/xylan/chitin deacetylase (PgdA/CDA1 family)